MKKTLCLAVAVMLWSIVYADDYYCEAPAGTLMQIERADYWNNPKETEKPIETTEKLTADNTFDVFVDGEKAIVLRGDGQDVEFRVILEKRGRVILKHQVVLPYNGYTDDQIRININDGTGQWSHVTVQVLAFGLAAKTEKASVPLNCEAMAD